MDSSLDVVVDSCGRIDLNRTLLSALRFFYFLGREAQIPTVFFVYFHLLEGLLPD